MFALVVEFALPPGKRWSFLLPIYGGDYETLIRVVSSASRYFGGRRGMCS
jgi:hypothetical protein